MTALYRAGQPTEALERYRDYRTLLAAELGLDPSPALRDLQVRILGHNLPAAPPPAHRQVPAAAAWLIASTAFVGRDDDTAALLDAVGTHRLVTVTGTGGVGKTRLVAEALGSLTERYGLPVTVTELAGATAGQTDGALAVALGLGATAAVRTAVLEYLGIAAEQVLPLATPHDTRGRHSLITPGATLTVSLISFPPNHLISQRARYAQTLDLIGATAIRCYGSAEVGELLTLPD
jgi:hypothetical protein